VTPKGHLPDARVFDASYGAPSALVVVSGALIEERRGNRSDVQRHGALVVSPSSPATVRFDELVRPRSLSLSSIDEVGLLILGSLLAMAPWVVCIGFTPVVVSPAGDVGCTPRPMHLCTVVGGEA
jgi:hypothetical protein